MFRGLLNPQGERRARSKSPGRPAPRESHDDHSTTDEERPHRKPSRGRYTEPDSDEDVKPEAPRYVERTPDAYDEKPSKHDRKRSGREDEYEYGRKPSKKYAEPEVEIVTPLAGRRERDAYADYAEKPKSARPSSAVYTNGDSLSYAAFAGNGTIPGGFPGQSVKPPASPQSRPQSNQYADVGKMSYAKVNATDIQYKYNNGSNDASYSKAYDSVPANKPSASTKQKAYVDDGYGRKELARPVARRESSDKILKGVAEAGRRQSYHRERSPAQTSIAGSSAEQLRRNLGRLSTSGTTLGVGTTPVTAGGRPPASPLLEAYKGTYQTISPLPSPLAMPVRREDDDELSSLDLSGSDSEEDELTKKIKALQREKERVARFKLGDHTEFISPKSSGPRLEAPGKKSRASSAVSSTALVATKKGRKAVSFYEPEADAEKIADALKGTHRHADTKPLLKILPWLTADEIIHLKTAYKGHAKINGQGINLSKHIKARVTGNLGKIMYATSLGQYESDAYWANCFYQSGASRRELLIESLVGRTNQQVREIKDVFKDKRYDDDLEKCMKAELKADKFRVAILIALSEQRMSNGIGIDMRLVHEDGQDLYDALNNPGGETAMIKIVMLRSDDHLKEVLRYYEKSYRRNFARDMISKSQNLVGETLAHILNGALNRPMRDAILLHQAIDEFAPQPVTARTPSPNAPKPNVGRAELLISRAIRLHWDPRHLERVKAEYEERYGETVVRAMARDVQGGMKTEEGKAWTGFCIDLIRSSER